MLEEKLLGVVREQLGEPTGFYGKNAPRFALFPEETVYGNVQLAVEEGYERRRFEVPLRGRENDVDGWDERVTTIQVYRKGRISITPIGVGDEWGEEVLGRPWEIELYDDLTQTSPAPRVSGELPPGLEKHVAFLFKLIGNQQTQLPEGVYATRVRDSQREYFLFLKEGEWSINLGEGEVKGQYVPLFALTAPREGDALETPFFRLPYDREVIKVWEAMILSQREERWSKKKSKRGKLGIKPLSQKEWEKEYTAWRDYVSTFPSVKATRTVVER